MKLEIVFEDGRKETFDGVASFNVTREKTVNEVCHAFEVAKTPTEGKLFEVNPLAIDRSRFKEPMRDERQERTRQIIQKAFAEVDKWQPYRYNYSFYTLIPERKWKGYKIVKELEAYASNLGGLMADWVEQALEWAQRISNGESWETICNNPDTAEWYRMITLNNGYYQTVGGSRDRNDFQPASFVHFNESIHITLNYATVPLVVIKKEKEKE